MTVLLAQVSVLVVKEDVQVLVASVAGADVQVVLVAALTALEQVSKMKVGVHFSMNPYT